MTRPYDQGDVSVDGRRLRYAEYGERTGFPVVMCHGTPGCRLDRHPDPSVYEGYRVIAYDRPGYGGSDPDPGRSIASAAPDVAAIADALGLEWFSVFGGSGGGPHALACGALLADRVERIAVRCGAAPLDDPEFDALAGIAKINVREVTAARESEEAIAAVVAPYVDGIAKDPDAVLEEIAKEVPEVDKRHLDRPEVRKLVRESMRESVRQGARGWIDDDRALVASWGFELGAVEPPVRIWQGELDVLVPRSHGEYLARKLPHATFELLPDYGHWMLDQVPAALRWLARG